MGAIPSKLVQRQSGEKSFAKLKKSVVYTIGGSHLLNDMMTVGIVPALLPIYKQVFNLNYTQAGLIVLVSYLTSSVMQPLFGYLTDKKPKPWALPLGVLLTGFGLSLTGYVTNYYFLLLAVAISGLGSGIFHPESNRCVFLASNSQRGQAQAVYQVGGNLGQALGALLIPLFLLSSGLKSMWVFFLLGILSFVMTIWMIPWYKEQLGHSMKLKKTLEGKSYPIAMLLLLIVVILRSWVQIGVAGFLPFLWSGKGHLIAPGGNLCILIPRCRCDWNVHWRTNLGSAFKKVYSFVVDGCFDSVLHPSADGRWDHAPYRIVHIWLYDFVFLCCRCSICSDVNAEQNLDGIGLNDWIWRRRRRHRSYVHGCHFRPLWRRCCYAFI